MILPENSTGLFVDRSILVLESKGLKLENSLRLCWLQQFERTTKEAIYASNKYLAEKLEISESKLSRLLKELEDFGFIERTVSRDPITKEIKKRLITTAPFLKLINGELKGIVTEGEQPKRDVPKVQPKKTENKDKPKKKTKNEYTEEFETFWKEYPTNKNMSKIGAFKSFKSKIKQYEASEIIEGAKRYAVFIEESGQYVAHATTFLNDERFLLEFEVPEWKKQKKYPEQQPVQGNNKFDFGFVNPQ